MTRFLTYLFSILVVIGCCSFAHAGTDFLCNAMTQSNTFLKRTGQVQHEYSSKARKFMSLKVSPDDLLGDTGRAAKEKAEKIKAKAESVKEKAEKAQEFAEQTKEYKEELESQAEEYKNMADEMVNGGEEPEEGETETDEPEEETEEGTEEETEEGTEEDTGDRGTEEDLKADVEAAKLAMEEECVEPESKKCKQATAVYNKAKREYECAINPENEICKEEKGGTLAGAARKLVETETAQPTRQRMMAADSVAMSPATTDGATKQKIAKIDVVKSSTKKLVQQGITKPIFNQADAISSAMLMAKENSVVPEEQVLDAVVPIENINLSANVSVSDVMAIAAESKTKEKGANKQEAKIDMKFEDQLLQGVGSSKKIQKNIKNIEKKKLTDDKKSTAKSQTIGSVQSGELTKAKSNSSGIRTLIKEESDD